MALVTDSGLSVSPWMATAVPPMPRLEQDTEADVCIVGAGIAGLSTAYMLAREGLSVVVIDDGPIGGGETGRTTAHLATAPDEFMGELEKLFGADGARLAHQSHGQAVDTIETIATLQAIECDFERLDAYLFAPPGTTDTRWLEDEFDACRRLGVPVEKVEGAPLPGLRTGPALRFPRQAQFHPLKYLAGLTRAIQAQGGRLFSGARAQEFEGGSHTRVTTADGITVTARATVVATNTPVNERVRPHLKQFAFRTYAIGAPVPAGSVPRALFWDTDDPYHYVRLMRAEAPGRDLLVAGGEDHRVGQDEEGEARFERLAAWTKERFPMMEEVSFRWSGQVMEPADGLAFIGRSPGEENVYLATGDSGNGMTHGTIAGLLLTDLILERPNPFAELYDPGRTTLRAAGEYIKGNVQSTAAYARWLTGAEVESPDEIPPGEGAVIRRGLHMVAVSRDASGTATERSAVCPHLGCVVAWNRTEKSWDCPCHGSRFAADGHVLNGPAISDLKPAEEAEGR
jgi:glycine/D-amino acid oxidase-like deaminating enzyme/nitrite reductase/ring-hydroxylating ferredoxin subunit